MISATAAALTPTEVQCKFIVRTYLSMAKHTKFISQLKTEITIKIFEKTIHFKRLESKRFGVLGGV